MNAIVDYTRPIVDYRTHPNRFKYLTHFVSVSGSIRFGSKPVKVKPSQRKSNQVKAGQRWFKKRFKPGLEAEPDPDLAGSIHIEPGQVIVDYGSAIVDYTRIFRLVTLTLNNV